MTCRHPRVRILTAILQLPVGLEHVCTPDLSHLQYFGGMGSVVLRVWKGTKVWVCASCALILDTSGFGDKHFVDSGRLGRCCARTDRSTKSSESRRRRYGCGVNVASPSFAASFVSHLTLWSHASVQKLHTNCSQTMQRLLNPAKPILLTFLVRSMSHTASEGGKSGMYSVASCRALITGGNEWFLERDMIGLYR